VLAVTLRSQGMNEDADNYAYRAQILQTELLRLQGRWGPWLFLGLLWLISGFGYKLWRIMVAYGVVVLAFTGYYALATHFTSAPLNFSEALLTSFSAIHGRFGLTAAFTTNPIGPPTPSAWGAALEGVCGIVIEGVFIAMLVQRFFAR
jgi:hypothetical protein